MKANKPNKRFVKRNNSLFNSYTPPPPQQTWCLWHFGTISMTQRPEQRLHPIGDEYHPSVAMTTVTRDEPVLKNTHAKAPNISNDFTGDLIPLNQTTSSETISPFSPSGRGFRLKMCTTTAAQTTDATTSCPSPSASTERTTCTSLRTATLTPTPGCSTTWPVWSAGTCPTCRGSCWA